MIRNVATLSLLGALSACAAGNHGPTSAADVGMQSWEAIPVSTSATDGDYRIGALDLLDVRVFQVADLSMEKVQVDAAGNMQMPLVGSIRAQGRTPAELADDIRLKLGERYLQNPQVSVTVTEAASQKVTVDGAVVEPGVFEMKGNTSLLQAVAMAKGPSRTAALSRVAVFRVIDGQRMLAVFDLAAVRRGEAEDPRILGDDIVVVDGSARAAAFRDLIAVMPALAIFRPY